MNHDKHELWDRIQAFPLDDPQSAYPFSARLAKENGWEQQFAQRVIEEYKRFVFLCVAGDHVACPSEEVDQAWHLHLTYTRSYWDAFCKETLGRPLHHEPTKGGSTERGKHWQMYEQTLASYRRCFGIEPPADIWPGPEERFTAARIERVDVEQYWLIPRWPLAWTAKRLRTAPRLAGSRAAWVAGAGIVGVPLLAAWNPLDLRGPEFLGLMLTGAAAIVILRMVLKAMFLIRSSSRSDDLDPYEAAILTADCKAAALAAVGSLVRAGAIDVKAEGTQRYALKGTLPTDASPLEFAVHAAVKAGADGSEHLFQAVKDDTDKIEARLTDEGLLEARGPAAIVRWTPTLLMLGLLALGVAKIYVGLSRGRPIEFLIFVCIGVFIGALVLAQSLRVSSPGKKLLEAQRKKFLRLNQAVDAKPAKGATPVGISPFDVAMGMGLFGVMALPGLTDLDPLRQQLRQNQSAAGWFDGSSSGGSSGCGGSGCGGGGGGCGGCGGD